jgi:transposase
MVRQGSERARRVKRAQVLLATARGEADAVIARMLPVGTSTVFRTKRRFVEEELDAALSEAPRTGGERKLSGEEEALLVAIACSSPPQGRARWTMELVAGEMVRRTGHEALSDETVRRRREGTSRRRCPRARRFPHAHRSSTTIDVGGTAVPPTSWARGDHLVLLEWKRLAIAGSEGGAVSV